MTEKENYLLQGISLVLDLLESRLDEIPLTDLEKSLIQTYNAKCKFHPVSTDPYCKYCKGIKVGIACKEGISDQIHN